MKKHFKKMKGKKVLSLVLAAIMLATTFNIAIPMLKLDASARGETINGITQTRIVPDGTYQSTYASFSAAYLNGYSEPTELVIPGLTKANNYVVQGMTYYPEKNWVLVTAYHNSDTPSPSMVYCLDIATGDFVAMFSFINVDGTPNTDHGGGIAISENNIYYSCGDKDRSIAYAPLSAIEGIENDATKYRTVQLADEVTFYEIGSVTDGDKTAYSAYCCYDQGVLWTGNFYDKGVLGLVAADYDVKAHSDYPSMVWGYELSGDNSEEEWARLTKKFNKIKIATASNTITGTGATMTYNAVDNGSSIDITGNVTYDGTVATVGELTANFGYYYLEEGNTYTIEYTATNDSAYENEIFLFAPNGNHTNIHQATDCVRTDLGNGTYKYELTFTAGLKPAGANSSWPTTQSTDGSYTGRYTIRFDQNNISASRDFSITGLAITTGDSSKTAYEKVASVTDNYQGQPTYVIALPKDIIDVQYATVDDGRLYLSRSYGTGTETSINAGMEEYSKLSICDIDLTVPGTGTITFTTDANGTTNTVNDAYIIPSMQTYDLMPMSEGLCVIDDYVYMTFESACYKYYEDAGIMGNCNHPVDVVWKIDQYGLLGHERPDETPISAYQKVNDVSEIDATGEYIVVFESDLEAEGNQNKILYALDTYGGYKGDKLPKSNAGTKANTLDSMGMVGHKITDYHKYTNSEGNDFIILNSPQNDDLPNIRWHLIGAGTDAMRIHSVDLYNATYSNLYFDSRLIYMSTDANTNLDNIKLVNKEVDGASVPGEFWIYNSSNDSYLWCNDGSDEAVMNAYDTYYKTGNTQTQKFTNAQEIPGTFHADAKKLAASADSGNQGSAIAAPYDLGTFNIYKRITVDPETMGGTGLETDLTAELQADGTYTINVGTYATSAAHKYLGESGYPTDFMFVLDASGSMTNNSDYVTYNNQGNLAISRAFANDSEGYYVYVDQVEKADGSIVTVNQFCKLNGHYSGFLVNVKYWVGAEAQDGSGAEYMLDTDGTFKWSKDQINTVGGSDTTITDKLPVYRKATTTRLQGMKDAVNSFIEKIDKNAQTFNTEHRIAIATFGSDGADDNSTAFRNTGIYSTLNGTTINQYTTAGIDTAQYAAAFYPSNHANLKTIVNSIDTSVEDPDTFSNYGFEMATGALAQQSPAFGGAGDKYYSDWTDPETGIVHEKNANAVVIFLTDGVPGKGGTDSATATTVANAAIPYAELIKANGGVVYSLQVSNASMDGFDMSAYMNGTSSNYPSATGLTSLGTQASSEYYTKAATDGSVDVKVVLDGVFNHIENNYIDTGTAITLDTDSIVRQVLGDHFKLTSESTVTTSESSVSEDVLGNIKFGAGVANDLTPTIDVENNTVQVTGFDFSSNYYAKNEKQGKRLNIVIENVLPVDMDEESMEVINQTYTAIYENVGNMEQNKKFKGYPNVAFTIPEYTYVLDYGIKLLDTDVNGTLKAVSEGLTKQDVNNYNTKSGYVAISDNSLDLEYSTTPTTKTTDSRYVLIQRDSGEYDWFEINVVPASNIYFEETEFATDAGTGTVAWSTTTDGTSVTERNLPGEKDVYGFDSAYDNTNTYSNGTTLSASVDSTNKRSKTATVSFAGNGIDIVSACGPTTGMQLINIKDADGKSVAASIVDTYYADGNFSQVPVFSWRGNYGEYTVETTAIYLSIAGALKKSGFKSTLVDTGLVMNSSDNLNTANVQAMLDAAGVKDIDAENLELVWFDDNSVLNGGTGVAPAKKGARAGETSSVTLNNYLDGFRIYNPLGEDSSYYKKSEQSAVYYNVIDSLVDGTFSDGSLDFASGTVAFVTGNLAEGETLSFTNYESVGPKNELYLKGNATNGVTFKTPVADGGRVMVSLRAVDGATTVNINGNTFTVTSATEMYYDITELLTVADGKASVTIINSGNGILAVNNIKLTNAVATSNLMLLSSEDLETAQYYASVEPVEVSVKNGVVTPVAEEDVTDDDTNTDNNDTNTDSGEDEEFSIFSLIEILLAFIEKILRGSFGSGKLF